MCFLEEAKTKVIRVEAVQNRSAILGAHTSHHQAAVEFVLGSGDAFGHAASVVFGEAVLLFQEIGDGLRLDEHFDTIA